jgi:hypothetical protein
MREGALLLVVGAGFADARLPFFPGYWLLHLAPPALAIRMQSRAIVISVLAVAVLAALGLDALRGSPRWRGLATGCAAAAVASLLVLNGVPLVAVAYRASTETMPVLPAGGQPTVRVLSSGYTSQLSVAEQGGGVLNDYYGWHLSAADENVSLEPYADGAVARPGARWDAPAWAGAVTSGPVRFDVAPTFVARPDAPFAAVLAGPERCPRLSEGCPRATVGGWTQPVVVEADAAAAETLVVAIAFVPGWSVRVDGGAWQRAAERDGLVAVPALTGRHRYELRYETPNLLVGVLATAASAVCVLWLLRRRHFQLPGNGG